MWDATGRDITREQIASIPGAVPTGTIGEGFGNDVETGKPAPPLSMIAFAKKTIGTIGNVAAPELWMFIDPQCSFSIHAMKRRASYIATGRVRLHVIPLSILDSEYNGMSTRSALSHVRTPADQMVAAWENGHLPATALSDAGVRLQTNMAAAAAVQVTGTPHSSGKRRMGQRDAWTGSLTTWPPWSLLSVAENEPLALGCAVLGCSCAAQFIVPTQSVAKDAICCRWADRRYSHR
jgi:thiol:disulfide interchange protein DsbG